MLRSFFALYIFVCVCVFSTTSSVSEPLLMFEDTSFHESRWEQVLLLSMPERPEASWPSALIARIWAPAYTCQTDAAAWVSEFGTSDSK